MLLGEDEGLGRAVWIAMRPSGTEATSDARRAVGRLARPRWLGAGEGDGWSWEAFVAPSGRPLPDVVRAGGPLGWHAAREALEDLAVELDAACGDGTLPGGMTPASVRVQPDGRLFLSDGLIDPQAERGGTRRSRPATTLSGWSSRSTSPPTRRGSAPLGGAARADRAGSHATVGSPVPGHAIGALERLCGPGTAYESVAEFLADLESKRREGPRRA